VSSHIERDRNKAEGLDVDVAFVVVAFSVRLPSSRGPPNIGRSTSAVPGSGEPIACICSLRLRVQGEGVVRVIPGSVSGVFGPSLDPGDDLESRSCRPAIGGLIVIIAGVATRQLGTGVDSLSGIGALVLGGDVSLRDRAALNSSAVKLLPR
jgi:hypothetical protein